MKTIPRDVLQTIITKLDLGYISLQEAKRWVFHTYAIEINARTKSAFIKLLVGVTK